MGLSEAVLDFNKHDPTKAEDLLKAAGGSPDVVILAQSSGYWPSMAEIIQADLNAVGFNAKINSVDSAVFYGTGNQGKQDIFLGEGSPDTFQPYGLYVTFFGQNNARKGRWGGWWNAAFDKAVTELTTDINQTAIQEADQLHRRLLAQERNLPDQLLPVPCHHLQQTVKGLVPLSVNELACFKAVSLA